MQVAIIIPQRGFKDESLAVAKSLFAKWHIDPVIASYYSGECLGYHGAVVRPDQNAAVLRSSDFDAMLLIDGPGIDQYKMYDFRPLLDMVRLFHANNKIVAGIGNSVKILSRANVIADTKIAVPSDDETRRLATLYKGALTKNYLEFDKNVFTLSNPEKAEELVNRMLEKLGVK